MFECTWKTCCLISTINQGSKVTRKNFVLFCSAWSLPLYCKILNEKYSEIKEWQSVEVRTPKFQEIFCPILLKNIKISNAHNFGNTGPISKIPTLLSSEAWGLSPYKILWILVRVRWKIPILLDHLTWNDPYLYVKESESEILTSLELELDSDILSLTLQPWVAWVELGNWKLRCHFWCYNNNIRSDVFRSFFDICLMFTVWMNFMLKTIFMVELKQYFSYFLTFFKDSLQVYWPSLS